ncbi:ATP-binding protein [Streptomyces sp. NBC_00154]|uniref:sensor histidine kinase n=1 Tax=Streptomyces sp. NBC_00154 TaxID=2975670 RepID=UPI002B1E45FC|nr:ATP-binding protein [Streptomyces sp. NBC_00154]
MLSFLFGRLLRRMQMELASPPSAGRALVVSYSWWLMPLALGAGTVAAVVGGPDQVQVPAAFVGVAATAASAVCVRLLVRARGQLRRGDEGFRRSQAELSRQWEQHVAGLEGSFGAERSGLRADLVEQARDFEARLVELARAHEAGVVAQAGVWEERLAVQRAVVGRLGDVYLPDALKRLREGEAIDDILLEVGRDADAGPQLGAELRKVLRAALIGVEEEFDRSTSAEQAVISIGSRIHVLTSKLRGRLHEMQGEHGRLPVVARGLMELDQEIGPADCLAASVGVLGGSDRPGRQWQEPQRLLSVVRGGIGRIKDFDRVQVRHLPELGVDGGLVDHLTLIFAHLLDNAARYSPPTEAVVVSGKEVPNGVGIEIQDAGKGLSEEKKREAEQSLAGTSRGPGLGGISEDANLGLRVVGALARRYGIRVTFADSPWLGTSVVVVVPHKFFSQLPAVVSGPPAPAAAAPAAVAVAEPVRTVAVGASGVVDTTPGGLPRRRSIRNDLVGPQPGGAVRGQSVAAVPPDASFAGLAAFATAGRESGPPHETATDRAPVTDGASATDRAPVTDGASATDRAPVTDGASATDRAPVTDGASATDRAPVTDRTPPLDGVPVTSNVPVTNALVTDRAPVMDGVPVTHNALVTGGASATDGVPVTDRSPAAGRVSAVGGVPVVGGERVMDGEMAAVRELNEHRTEESD